MLDYAKAHSEDMVRDATSSAFRSIEDAGQGCKDLKEAMSALTALKVALSITQSASAVDWLLVDLKGSRKKLLCSTLRQRV